MTHNTIWITGAEGKLGSELVEVLSANVENKVIGTDIDVDITDIEVLMQTAEVYRPNIIINCASISNVETCEKDRVLAYKVNAIGARNLASVARHVNAKIVQMSTDDVFAGNRSGYLTEFDNPMPTTVYGKSKLAGENLVKELNTKHLIIRSSWVYGFGKDDFFSYVKEMGEKGQPFSVATDNISSPTSAKELAKVIAHLITKTEYGVYHASCEGTCSRSEFAKAILEKLGYDKNLVKEVFENEDGFMTSTVLENLMMKITDVYEMAPWEKVLDDYIAFLKKNA